MEVGIVRSFGSSSNGQPVSYGWIERQGTLAEYLQRRLTHPAHHIFSDIFVQQTQLRSSAEYLQRRRTQPENTSSLSNIFVHRTQLRCLEDKLQKGVFVLFEVEVNLKKDSLEACNVDLLREIGIVKWFGGYNSKTNQENDFGFIEQLKYHTKDNIYGEKDDIRVHQSQINGLADRLKEGVLVTFGIKRNFITKRDEALDVQLLHEEDEIIEHYLPIADYRIWRSEAVWKYLGNLQEQKAVLMIAKNIEAFDASLKESIVEKLPVSLRNSIYSKHIRDLLSPKTQLDWCMSLINVDIADIKDEILNTLQVWTANEVKHCSNNGIESGSYFGGNSNSEFSKQFSKYLVILLEKRLLTVNEALELVTNTFCQMQSTQQKEFVNSLPLTILCHPQAQILRNTLFATKHFEICVQMLNAENISPNSELKEEILTTAVSVSKLTKQEAHWEKIPSNWYEDNLSLCQFIPSKLRIPRLIEIFLQTEEREIKEQLLDELVQGIQHSSDINWDNIPLSILSNEKIWVCLPKKILINVVLREIEQQVICSHSTIERIIYLLNSLPTSWLLVRGNPRTEFIKKLPYSIKRLQSVFSILSLEEKVDVLVNQLENTSEKSSAINQLIAVITNASTSQIPNLLKLIPNTVKRSKEFLKFLEPDEQVEQVLSALSKGSITEWEKLSWQAKVLSIYRATKENIRLPQVETLAREEHLLVECILTIFRAKYNPHLQSNAFQSAHKLFQDYVVKEAWQSTKPLELKPLLPPCSSTELQVAHLKYCEATPWDANKDGNLKPYCPRLGNTQCTKQRLNLQLEGNWQDWSLTEFLIATGIHPILSEEKFSSAGHYVTKLSGWVNRLNEIRERLQCSHCQQIMVSEMSYARNLARYNATVFSCLTKAQGHDQGVYLSHCWACWGINPKTPIIDSREGSFDVKSEEIDPKTGNIKSYYLCIFCGSGPRLSNWFTQGDYCPKCGTPKMQLSDVKPVKKSAGVMCCKACGHKIQLPRKDKITGHKENLELD